MLFRRMKLEVALDRENVLQHMTLHEKCMLLAGADCWHTAGCERLGVPPVMMADGPHGLRKQEGDTDIMGVHDSVPVTCFPTSSAMACSFDTNLIERIGAALGDECRANGVNMILGPGVNIKRSPLCGRNFEYFSEDPYLAGKMAAAHIRGVQSRGVGTSLKHFAGNSQEKARMTSDSVIDSKALHEIYLHAFRIAVEEGRPWTVMTAYNRLNGVYCSENRFLIKDTLRGLWHFDGMVLTDWEALSSVIESLPAGLDLVMPGARPDYTKALERAVQTHTITTLELNSAVRHILEFTDRCMEGQRIPSTCDKAANLHLAREAAARCAVLLENDGVLPLSGTESMAVIGSFAKTPRYQGTGSSRINPIELDCIWDALCERYPQNDMEYAIGYDAATGLGSEEQMVQAEQAAACCDVAIVVAGLPDSYESEGYDRYTMRMPNNQVHLIERVCAVNPHTVVVLQGGAPFELPWHTLPAAILLMYLSGCQGGHATVDLLSGDANPAGKLAETWPIKRVDAPTAGRFPSSVKEILYYESIYIGYRYYDAVNMPVAYPFGYGLSYTTFDYDDLRIEPIPDEFDGFRVSCNVRNTGTRLGAEAVQLYIAPVDPGVFKAPQTLHGFTSVELQPGQEKRVEFMLDARSFAHYDAAAHIWRIEAGEYKVRIAASSRDVRLRGSVQVDGDAKVGDNAPRRYHHPTPGCFSASAQDALDDFKVLYGKNLPEQRPLRPFTPDSTMEDTSHSFFGMILVPFVRATASDAVSGDVEDSAESKINMLEDMPIRSIHMRGMQMETATVMVNVLNRHYVRGFTGWCKVMRTRRAKKLAARATGGEGAKVHRAQDVSAGQQQTASGQECQAQPTDSSDS